MFALRLSCLLLLLAPVAWGEGQVVDFNRDVRPLFVRHCLACHGGVQQAAGFSLVTREQALLEGDSIVTPGDHRGSALYERVAEPDDDLRMPPAEHGRRLDDEELATLRQWIDQGARWDDPWAFKPPVDALDGSLDSLIVDRLAEEGLGLSPAADREQWLRRVSFDLVGLPPTEAERIAFQNDLAVDAHQRVVDRLFASRHFGERWASVWLDLARYADTMGFEKDPPREIWPWRDWVVGALNADMPYDEFLLKQTAGDLLPHATLDDRLATAFHRNTQTNTEGGTDDEEYRWAAVVDRVDTLGAAVLGLTIGCARCHDHPYDPIRQQDYYRFAALLNTTQDSDLPEDLPKLTIPSDRERFAEAARLDAEVRRVRAAIHATGVAACGENRGWVTLPIDHAESTGETRLAVRYGEPGYEVFAEGTVTDRSRFTLAGATPSAFVTAVRIDARPIDPEAALATPEIGFVLSRVRVFVQRTGPEGGSVEEEIFPVEVLADETDGFFRPIEMLRDNPDGWGPYTRMRRPRWAVLLFDELVQLEPDDRIRVELKHGKATDGQGALVMRRFAVSVSADGNLTRLARSRRLLSLREREEELLAARAEIPGTRVPVLVAQPSQLARPTHVMNRGAWRSPAERVEPGAPAALRGEAANRLELGRWMGSRDNPLTARVMVNRVWAELMGVGLVETVDDFGSAGAMPTNQALLDGLAVRFMDDFGWSLKRLLREIVLSQTYRQDSKASAELVQIDPNNRLLARGPRGRLRAEMVRDQALLLSGRFNPNFGGPPVMPYQPDGVWRSVYNDRRWETAEGDQRFRRALYTYWKRTAAYPSLVAFDAPSREQCSVRRLTTNTPLQALVTLNDPAFVELAEGFADRILARPEETIPEKVAWAAREATGTALPDGSLDELTRLYAEVADQTPDDPRFVMKMIANVLLNLDATLSK